MLKLHTAHANANLTPDDDDDDERNMWSTLTAVFLLLLTSSLVICRLVATIVRTRRKKSTHKKIVAFFHPYCNAGGGGERVLWRAVQEIFANFSHCDVVVYTGDEASAAEILALAQSRFGLRVDQRVRFVRLRTRELLDARHYPFFSLAAQSMASVVVALEAAARCVPDVFVDSMGFAFSFPVFRYLVGATVACYVHYPTISTDMLEAVASARPNAVHNAGAARSGAVRTRAKLIYYDIFARCYGWSGSNARVVMTNSSWTDAHIRQLWRCPSRVVYPPCDTSELSRMPLEPRRNEILSVAQFRPEKDHTLQLRAFAMLLHNEPQLIRMQPVTLVLLGGMRNDADRARVDALRALAAELGIASRVQFVLNASLSVLHEHLAAAAVGIHTMWNEHFGIGVVELMAAGVVVVAHNSGGPKADIVRHGETGFLAESESEYARCLATALTLSKERRGEIQRAARSSVERFSDAAFGKQFNQSMREILQ